MDVGNNREKKKKSGRGGLVGFGEMMREGVRRRREDSGTAAVDIAVFLVALVFARCHLLFGSYPLALALVSVLPAHVWVALAGACIGSLTLGRAGVVYALIAIIAVFLRIVISGTGERRDASGVVRGSTTFSENLLLRMSASVIGGFIAAVYEILLSGFSLAGIAFGLSMVFMPAALVFGFSGLFDAGIRWRQLLFEKKNIFSTRAQGKDKYNLIFFQISALVFLFFLCLALDSYSLMGISLSYIFAGVVTVFTARRFGALRAAAVGFLSTLGLSGIYSAAYALAGLACGLLFPVGVWYALAGGTVAVGAWSAYVGGLNGFLAVLPEFIIAALVGYPLYRRLQTEAPPAAAVRAEQQATDMVGTTALSYRQSAEAELDALERAFAALSPMLRQMSEEDSHPTREAYRDMCLDRLEAYRRNLPEPIGGAGGDSLYTACADALAQKLCYGEPVGRGDVASLFPDERQAEAFLEDIRRGAAALERDCYRGSRTEALAEDYELFAKIMSEIRRGAERERQMNESLSEKLGEVFVRHGFPEGVARAFGERRVHVIAAGEDPDGTRITDPTLRADMERALGVRLGTPEYFRKDNMVLLECGADRGYTVTTATAAVPGGTDEVSGDTALCFETGNGHFYALISDGMGTGEQARATSSFCAAYLQKLLETGCSKSTALHMLNLVIRRRGEECSATVDLLDYDLLTGEATFVKSGAAASFVKRGDSLFRIRSRTLPIGVMPELDAEKVRAQVRPEDYIVMISDGVSPSPEESPWLLELLAGEVQGGPREYADAILAAARRNSVTRDDMTVLVAKITAA